MNMKKDLIKTEPILFLFALILIVILLFVFWNNWLKQKELKQIREIKELEAVLPDIDTAGVYCGISIIDPSINSEIWPSKNIVGYISGCGWDPYLKYVAKMKIFDENEHQVWRTYLISKTQESTLTLSNRFIFSFPEVLSKDQKIKIIFESFGSEKKQYTVPLKFILTPKDENINAI